MNDPKPSLFARYDPLVKAPVLFTQLSDEEWTKTISIRPIWIIGDLFTINEWLASTLKKCNWQINQNRMTVSQHYKQVLLSDTAQSLILEQGKAPVMQIDILKGLVSNYPGKIDFGKWDYIINYLYKESFRDTGVFKRCIHSVVAYLFSFPETGYLYLKLPKTEPALQDVLIQIGFELVDENNFFGKSLNIYRVRRIGIKL